MGNLDDISKTQENTFANNSFNHIKSFSQAKDSTKKANAKKRILLILCLI